ncbi:MAG: HlyC/CorC family transporter [Clostridia bacterium]|nr:HlyC/CorC family transporter [Clostridia bacterium]
MDLSLILTAGSGSDKTGILIAVIIVLVLLSGFFSGTETAFSCANKIKLKTLVSQGKHNAKAVYKFADEKYDKLVTAILIGNNIVNLSASALGTILFAILLGNKAYTEVVSTAVLTVTVLIFGEITPKYLASIYPEKVCFLFYPLMQLFFWLLWPICKIFDGYKWVLAKIFKLKKDDTVTDEELLFLVEEAEESGTLKEDESELVRSALEFDDLKVEDILVPRVNVYAVEEDSTMDEVRDLFESTGYSRLPVYKDTIDNVIGLIHERDFYSAYVRGEKTIGHFVQDIVFTSEYTRISTLLKQLQKQKIHMAAVSDEYGGLVGIVTLEDILEELVGEIWDEHDEEEVLYGEVAKDEYWVDGKCDLEEFFSLYDMEKEDEEFDSNTVGGWVTEECGEIPPIGKVLTFKGLEIKIVKATKQKVLKIRSCKIEGWEEEEDD